MPSAGPKVPAIVYLLADHLDTALAAGEDLLKSSLTWLAGDARDADDLCDARRQEREAIDAARALEMLLLARILKSREGALDLAKVEIDFRPLAKLYAAGTEPIAEAALEMADKTSYAFDAGDGVTAFLRSRGLIAEDAAAPLEAETLAITEEFQVAGRMNLGALLDLVAMFLDTLETHYDLYEEPIRSEAAAAAEAATTGAAV
jgi:hypothetical protein